MVYYNTELLSSASESQKSKLGQQSGARLEGLVEKPWPFPASRGCLCSSVPGPHHCDSASLPTSPQTLPVFLLVKPCDYTGPAQIIQEDRPHLTILKSHPQNPFCVEGDIVRGCGQLWSAIILLTTPWFASLERVSSVPASAHLRVFPGKLFKQS